MAVCDDSRRAADRICAEYGQVPGLSLTGEQAARLLGLDRVLVVAVLQALERGAFLVRSATGQFVRWDHALRRGYSNPGLRHLAETTGVTDATALYVVLAAGYTADTARLLPLAPLLLVAWADGTMSDRERWVILDAASADHIEQQPGGQDQLARARDLGGERDPQRQVLIGRAELDAPVAGGELHAGQRLDRAARGGDAHDRLQVPQELVLVGRDLHD